MALAEFLKQLDELVAEASEGFQSAPDAEALEAARVEFLGAKQGRLKAFQKQMGRVDKAERPAAGKRFNEVKNELESALEAAQQRLATQPAQARAGAQFDPTLPGKPLRVGRLHPLTQTVEELKDIMGRLGFSVAEGPEIEDEWHNFEALNIPDEHPARDPLENFYLATAQSSSRLLLRSQTSTVQIRVMEQVIDQWKQQCARQALSDQEVAGQRPPAVRIISLGRVYRPDEADATHYPMFHQMEGLLIDTQVTMADLKSVLRLFAASYLGADVHIRFRPSFFPFTEPSVEVDFSWNEGWIEFGGAGMVDPHVLGAVGYDPEQVTGFAFGLGIERLCMRRHNIPDIREFYKNDVRFLQQF